MSQSNFSYRPEIDGLRAIAVLAVVLYHVGLSCPGGYVGVDVFFVISGYLITSLILRDLNRGSFSMANFWERRIRRILPAFAVTVLLTLVAGFIILLPSGVSDLGRSAIAQTLIVANIFFWRTGGYFGPVSIEKPLLHTWSLAVEEQFYLIFPILLWLLFRFQKFHQTRPLIIIFSIGFILSLTLSAVTLSAYPEGTFYLLPTRAWELIAGSLVAVIPADTVTRSKTLREIFSWIGLAGIIGPIILYTEDTPFPGIAALPPVIGTALIIWFNSKSSPPAENSPTLIAKALQLRPLVFIGLISYSLYLWHWPVIVYSKYWALAPLSLIEKLMIMALSTALAILSWRFVETPFRKLGILATRKRTFGFATATTLCMLVIGGFMATTSLTFPIHYPEMVLENEKASLDTGEQPELTVKDVTDEGLYPFGVQDKNMPVSVLLWGDSHAMRILSAMDLLCKEAGVRGQAATHSATPPLVGFYGKSRFKTKAPAFAAAVVNHVKTHQIKHVVLTGLWGLYHKLDQPEFEKAVITTVRQLNEAGCKVWILMDVPNCETSPTRAMSKLFLFQSKDISWRRTVADHHQQNSAMYQFRDSLDSATFIDPAPAFLEPGTDRYKADIDGIAVYTDNHHLTTRGANQLVLPVLRQAMAEDLKAAAKPSR